MKEKLGIILLFLLLPALAASAAPPEVSFVLLGPEQWWMRPDAGKRPAVITGENFNSPDVEVWTWTPPAVADEDRPSGPMLGWTTPALPAKPPSGAVRAAVLDTEDQVLTVDLGRRPGNLLWVKNKDGFSEPYLFNTAGDMGFWIMDDEVPQGGETFGFNLGPQLRLVGPGGTFAPARVAGPSSLCYFKVPVEVPLGDYQLYTHNGQGAAYGWHLAGTLKIVSPRAEPRTFPAEEFGARGDGRSACYDALSAAVKAAASAGGGEVFLAPGTYLINKTLEIPSGVTLRGASRQNTVLKTVGPVEWAVMLKGAAGLRDLTLTAERKPTGFSGLVGGGGEGMSIIGCELLPQGEYAVLIASPQARRFRMKDNIVQGSLRIFWHGASRAEIVGNTFLRGGFGGRPLSESVFARNIVRDAPGRNAFDSTCRSLFEQNEVHGFWYGPYPEHNWEEVMMSHGAGDKMIGHPTASTASSLTESGRAWKPGEHRGKTVLIMEGRGFGQYRQVLDNTADTLTLERPWRVQPDGKSRYALGTCYVENIYRQNLIDGWGVFVLWLDQINNRVQELHTIAAGCVLWGRDGVVADAQGKLNGSRYNPSWYNIISDSSLEGGNVSIETAAGTASPYAGPVLFANMIANNRITSPHLRRMSRVRGLEQGTHYQTGPLISSHAGVALTDLKFKETPGTTRRATHTIISGNYFVDAPCAVELQDVVGKTFILNNQYQFVSSPLLAGAETKKYIYAAGNSSFTVGEDALRRQLLPDVKYGVEVKK